jgi:hypothetical protein
VGEIGITRSDFLYTIQFWEARRILRGYNNRNRGLWSATRWQTFYLMSAFAGTDQMKKNHWHKPADLLQFPWEKEPAAPMTEKEISDMQADMQAFQSIMRNEQ